LNGSWLQYRGWIVEWFSVAVVVYDIVVIAHYSCAICSVKKKASEQIHLRLFRRGYVWVCFLSTMTSKAVIIAVKVKIWLLFLFICMFCLRDLWHYLNYECHWVFFFIVFENYVHKLYKYFKIAHILPSTISL